MFSQLPQTIPISAEMLRLVSEIDEFKGHFERRFDGGPRENPVWRPGQAGCVQ